MRKYWSYIIILLLLATVPFSVLVAKQGVRLYSRAVGQNANIVIDASSNLGELARPWEYLAQGGEQTTLFDVINEVKELKIKYVRIDHVFDQFEVMPSAGVYNFSRLDKTIDAIISMGAKPMIALSYMPPAISASDIIGVPRNWGDWQELVKRMVEHYSGRDNKAISDIYYEVWNEPDLFGGFRIGGPKDYLQLYKYAAKGAMEAQNVLPFKIGGPATTAPYRNWTSGLLQFAAQEGLRIDFLSWHRYHYYPEQFSEDVNNVNYWISGFPQYRNIEKLVTEWGSDSEIRAVHDGIFDLAHTIAVSRVFADKIDHGYSFEVKDGPGASKFWGRWGILTNEKYGISKKPRYFGLKALSELSGKRLVLNGEGTWVYGMASKTGDKIKAVIVNYDPRGSHYELTPVTFTNVGLNNYLVSKTVYSSSNPAGEKSEFEQKTEKGVLSFDLALTANSAVLIELTKIDTLVTFKSGRSGELNDKSIEISQGGGLYYDAFETLDLKKGTVEFWVNPKWSGNEGGNYTFFEVPRTDGKVFGAYKTLVGTQRVLEFGIFEDRQSKNPLFTVSGDVSGWEANRWYHVAFSWDLTLAESSFLRLFIDGKPISSVLGQFESGLASEFYLGSSKDGLGSIEALIDDFRTLEVGVDKVEIFERPLTISDNPNTIRLILFNSESEVF